MYIPIILTTGRDGRMSEAVAKAIHAEVSDVSGIETELVDVKNYVHAVTIPGFADSPETQSWKDMAAKADGFIVVVPEYNHSFPGEFKITWDGADKEYKHKPVVVCSVSGGSFGGVRVMEHIRALWGYFSMPVAGELYVPNVQESVKDGQYMNEKFPGRVAKALHALQVYAKAMKDVRTELMKQ